MEEHAKASSGKCCRTPVLCGVHDEVCAYRRNVRCFAEWKCVNMCEVGHPLSMSLCLTVCLCLSIVVERALRSIRS